MLEGLVVGPVHKSVLRHGEYSFMSLSGPYWFSPSKTNTLLSLVVTTLWLLLIVYLLIETKTLTAWVTWTSLLALSAPVGLAVMIAVFGRSDGKRTELPLYRDLRSYRR